MSSGRGLYFDYVLNYIVQLSDTSTFLPPRDHWKKILRQTSIQNSCRKTGMNLLVDFWACKQSNSATDTDFVIGKKCRDIIHQYYLIIEYFSLPERSVSPQGITAHLTPPQPVVISAFSLDMFAFYQFNISGIMLYML